MNRITCQRDSISRSAHLCEQHHSDLIHGDTHLPCIRNENITEEYNLYDDYFVAYVIKRATFLLYVEFKLLKRQHANVNYVLQSLQRCRSSGQMHTHLDEYQDDLMLIVCSEFPGTPYEHNYCLRN